MTASDKNQKYNWVFFSSLTGLFFIIFFLTLLNIKGYRGIVLYDSDINWLFKTGEYIYQHGFKLPVHDIFSYTHPDKPWVVYQWLFEVILYVIYKLFGSFQAIGYFITTILVLTFTILFILLRKLQVHSPYIIIAISISTWMFCLNFFARPSSLTYLLLALVIFLLHLSEKVDHKYLWIIPFVFILWANVHLGFTFGILMLVVFSAIKFVEYFLNKGNCTLLYLISCIGVTFLSVVATTINPYGADLYSYMYRLANSSFMNNNIEELLSMNFHSLYYSSVLMSIFLILVLSVFSRGIKIFYLFMLAITLGMSLCFVRNVPFYSIFFCIVFALQLKNLHESTIKSYFLPSKAKELLISLDKFNETETLALSNKPKSFRLNLSCATIVVFLIIISLIFKSQFMLEHFEFAFNKPKERPLAAYNFVLKYKPPGNFYTSATWGSYAILKLYPVYKVFIDTRFDMYGEQAFREYYRISNTQFAWMQTLINRKVNWIVTFPKSLIDKELSNQYKEDWFIIYKDKTATIYMLNNPENKKWYDQSGLGL